MDGLRLALIVVGVAVVVAVYLWTVRRQRAERDAGEFHRYDAWPEDSADPLVDADPLFDADDLTQPNPRRDALPDPDEVAPADRGGAGARGHSVVDPDELTQPNPRGRVPPRGVVDPDELTQPNPLRRAPPAGAVKPDVAADGGGATVGGTGTAPEGAAGGARARPSAGTPEPRARAGDAGAKAGPRAPDVPGAAARARSEPRLGPLDEVQPAPDSRRAPSAGVAAGAASDTRREPRADVRGGARQNVAPRGGARENIAPRSGVRENVTPRSGASTAGGKPDGYPEPAPAEAELVVVLNVMAPHGQQFEGAALRDALEGAGLRAGEMQLYHYRAEAQPADAPPVFSALNAVKPGTLDPTELEHMATPGVALVLRLPGLERPVEAFELMHSTAQALATALGGRICDQTRSALTKQVLNHMRETIAEHVRRGRVGG